MHHGINGNIEIHKRSIKNIVIVGLIDSNKHEKNGAVQQKHQHRFIDEEYTML